MQKIYPPFHIDNLIQLIQRVQAEYQKYWGILLNLLILFELSVILIKCKTTILFSVVQHIFQ